MKITVIAFLLLLFSTGYSQQTSVYLSFNTGDREMDSHLNDVNFYASADMTLFRNDLRIGFNASSSDLDFYLVKERIAPASVYYGYVLSYSTGHPIGDVMRIYKEKKGWGAVAKELGIKPGSKEFHRLKNNTLAKIDKGKMKSEKEKNRNKSNHMKGKGKGNKKH